MTNQMAGTGLEALKCATGADPAPFGCHHGMKDGQPNKVCAGWLAALVAPPEVVAAVGDRLLAAINSLEGPDEVREAFDAWIAKVDPDNRLDDYQRGRLYLRSELARQA